MYFCLTFLQFSETFPPLKSSGSSGGRPNCIAILGVDSSSSTWDCCISLVFPPSYESIEFSSCPVAIFLVMYYDLQCRFVLINIDRIPYKTSLNCFTSDTMQCSRREMSTKLDKQISFTSKRSSFNSNMAS